MTQRENDRFLTIRQVQDLTSLARSTIYAAMKGGLGIPLFPKPIRLGRRSAWRERDIRRWMAERVAESVN